MHNTLSEHIQIGKQGECKALEYLKAKQYTIIQTNYRASNYEIDIIALFSKVLIFIEVKTRSTDLYGLPEKAVNNKKKQSLIRAAQQFISQTHLKFKESRFDVISIVKGDVFHIQDAFWV